MTLQAGAGGHVRFVLLRFSQVVFDHRRSNVARVISGAGEVTGTTPSSWLLFEHFVLLLALLSFVID